MLEPTQLTIPLVGAQEREPVLVNLGSGPREDLSLPDYFKNWKHLRVDVDPAVEPDVLADLTDLSPIPDGHADAVWASHCLEHLYEHEVMTALNEFRRIVRDDGFVCIIVPDLQSVANYVAADRMHEPIYDSPAGPVTPHDIFFGFGAAIASGRISMAHKCGFTPSVLQRYFERMNFGEVLLRRREESLELVGIARVIPPADEPGRAGLFESLGL
jgi:SAM-dependent methyltransferase